MTDILFLGTGASIPSKMRALPAIAVRHGSDMVLFDCGEGVQRQFMLSPFSFMKVTSIFITHLHGDHLLGLPGLLQTMGMSGRSRELLIAGPVGVTKSVENLLAACDRSYTSHDPDPKRDLEYPLKVIEMDDGDVLRFKGYSVEAFRTEHGVRSIGFKFIEDDLPGKFDKEKAISMGLRPGKDFADIQNGMTVNGIDPGEIIGKPRPGKTIVYSGDTVPCDGLSKAAVNADVLIHEATYVSRDGKLAKENKHSTAAEAAALARDANAKALILTHMSNRYDDLGVVLDDAKRIFENTVLAYDMLLLTITSKGIRSA